MHCVCVREKLATKVQKGSTMSNQRNGITKASRKSAVTQPKVSRLIAPEFSQAGKAKTRGPSETLLCDIDTPVVFAAVLYSVEQWPALEITTDVISALPTLAAAMPGSAELSPVAANAVAPVAWLFRDSKRSLSLLGVNRLRVEGAFLFVFLEPVYDLLNTSSSAHPHHWTLALSRSAEQ